VWTAVGLAAAFAVVGATSNRHRATTTQATAAGAVVASAASHECCASDDACASNSKIAVVTAPAAPKVKTAKPAAKPAPDMAPGASGMVIAIDPESGTLGMPSANQMQELRAQMALDETSHSMEGVTTTRMPDGAVRLNLNGTFGEYATVSIGPDGKKVFGCTSNPNALEQPAPTTLEEK
jgi:hypothetical protein